MKTRPWSRAALLTSLGIGLFMAGCAGSHEQASSGRTAGGGAEIPRSITLTPRTVVIRDGRRAMTRVSEDGASIALDATAPGVADIKPGSVVLIKDVVAVKAAAVRRDGNSVIITAAHAALTDLIQNADIRWNAVKVDFANGVTHTWAAAPQTPAGSAERSIQQGYPMRVAFVRPSREATTDGDRYAGKIGEYEYDAGYASQGGRLNMDGRLHGTPGGVTIDVAVKGYISNFEFGGRLAVQNGRADNVSLLLQKLEGQVELEASASREAGAPHRGQSLLEIPKSYDVPVIIDGIPFVLTLRFAILLNEGLTNVGGRAALATTLKLHGSQGAEWRLPGEPKAPPVPKAEGEMSLEFDITRSIGAGLGPQALLVAIQYPRIGFGLGWASAHAGSFIDVVTAASTVTAGAAAIVPCQRGEIDITGSAGVEAEFLVWERSTKVEVYKKTIKKVSPNIKACQ